MEFIDWTIAGRWDWSWYASGSVEKNEAGFLAFDIDLAPLPDGDYWIEFVVYFTDGWTYRKLTLRIGDEAPSTIFGLYFSIYGVAYAPCNFNSAEDYKMWYELFNQGGPTGYTGSCDISPDDWGDFELQFEGILYSPSTSVDGIDWIRIAIDHNDNGIEDDGDWHITSPVVLMQFEATYTSPVTHIGFDAEDMRPIFSVE